MLFLFESKVPENRSVIFALTYIYGIGKTNSFLICKKLGFSQNLKVKDLSNEQILRVVKVIDSFGLQLASELKKSKSLRIKTLINSKSYRGLRINRGLPVRGQRTHTNAKTSRRKP
jgi:small subunit ribosomal protein S13